MTLKEFKPAYFTIEERHPIVIATVNRSSLCEEDNIDQFGVELNQIVDGWGSHWLVLDLQSVTLMTSSAIGKLISLHRNLHRREGRLVLCGLNSTIRNVFQSAKLIDYFHVRSASDEAVELLTQEVLSHEPVTIVKV